MRCLLSLYKLFGDGTVTTPDGNTFKTGLPQTPATSGSIHPILQILFGVIGALALLFIIIAAIQFVTSSGDPQKVAKARQTILFAVAGLAIAILAEVIVTYVLNNV